MQILVRGFQDPHKVLGVEPGADDKQVKKAYKKLALKYASSAISFNLVADDSCSCM